ncbi:GGDEF domain-containing response regulator [Psychromonas ossibalaenae]|uniref:GGDEF domain-containing response regulator n=1 Tax=Psychromonas ossibalaenae TaxID=444922 RepID=UPI00036CCD8E|nr:diguanylate cyclase [Psychromonas ossibalaenae]
MVKKTIKYILVVEDSKMFTRILKRSIESVKQFKVISVENFAELKVLLAEKKHSFFAALLDVNLPDAPNGEVIDYVVQFDIPSIIFTGKLNERFRNKIYTRGIVDYVLKEGRSNVDYVVSLLNQLERNRKLEVLVVDDSKSVRTYIRKLLLIYQFQVQEAQDGPEALKILKENSNISLVLTDFNMPKMDGLELTKEIRSIYSSQEMAVIGMSTFGNNQLSARFLKLGGSDFLTKPFLEEEFFCRINQNMELLEHIRELKYLASRDHLTGLFNRRHFFEDGNRLFEQQKKKQSTMAVALLDIDFFKKVNDNYGHDAGDAVLQQLGKVLQEEFSGKDIAARFGGEEFCFLLCDKTSEQALLELQRLAARIADLTFVLEDDFEFKVTVSIGVFSGREGSLQSSLSRADKALYQAKENGRNQVILAE